MSRAEKREHAVPLEGSDGSVNQPAFLEALPEDPALDPLVQAFVRGDYLTVRRLAPIVAQSASSEAVREAAVELGARIRPDPISRYILAATTALLLLLIYWVYGGHAH